MTHTWRYQCEPSKYRQRRLYLAVESWKRGRRTFGGTRGEFVWLRQTHLRYPPPPSVWRNIWITETCVTLSSLRTCSDHSHLDNFSQYHHHTTLYQYVEDLCDFFGKHVWTGGSAAENKMFTTCQGRCNPSNQKIRY